ncbi:MAG: glycosyl hydrolase family 65 protein, partial [Rhodanobacteraceae bacterium]
VYGLTGLRVGPSGLVQAYQPVLPARWKSMTLKNVTFRGKHYDITVDRGADGKPRLRRESP